MAITQKDRDILRGLGEQVARIAALPVHKEKARLWRDLNDLKPTRPLVWINELPANELNVDDELTCRCEDGWARGQEWNLRWLLYQWNHFPCDMIVNDYFECSKVIRSTGLGIDEKVDIVRTDPTSGVVSRHFHRQIVEPEDIAKIRMPEVTYDEAATQRNCERLSEVFGDIMPVRIVGIQGTWFAPWDNLIRWWGVEDAMMDLVMRPQMVNDIMSHLVDCYLHEFDQWEKLNLFSLNSGNNRIGSGGYGYVSDLPAAGFDPCHVRAKDMWGCATAQIFSEVSPEMHWEFALRHEMRWLEKWGLTYYGCCEPLDIKMDILRRIPNLRKISMSPWIKPERAAAEVRDEYVFSHKPNPAILAEDNWHPERARQNIRAVLEKTRGCRVELILKDVSTVRYQPRRLWEWEKIAMAVAEEFAP